MSVEGAGQMIPALEARFGAGWDALLPHASYKAIYAFPNSTGRMTSINGSFVYLDECRVSVREPITAHFETADGFQFVLAAVHSNYAKSVAEREKEALALRSYLVWLNERIECTQAFLEGNFNLSPTNPEGA
tara:strand:- start:39 stop:434 length:396 start_codon:yes stop_codon:yes gene_type:complete